MEEKKSVLFLRKYGEYKIGKSYKKDIFKKDILEELIANGTARLTLEEEETVKLDISKNLIKDNYPEIYAEIQKEANFSEENQKLKEEIKSLKSKLKEFEK